MDAFIGILQKVYTAFTGSIHHLYLTQCFDEDFSWKVYLLYRWELQIYIFDIEREGTTLVIGK